MKQATRRSASKPRRSAADLMRERDQHWYLLLVEGYSYREIAARSNVTHPAVIAAIKRMPEAVKDRLRGQILGVA